LISEEAILELAKMGAGVIVGLAGMNYMYNIVTIKMEAQSSALNDLVLKVSELCENLNN
jgi:hypothetical protein